MPPHVVPKDQPVLVTGASGFIGRALVTTLRSQGQSVRALARRPEAADALRSIGAEPVIGDLLDRDVAQRVSLGVRGIYHLAGRLFRPGTREDSYRRLHVDATIALLEATIGLDLDFFVLCSTTGVHGPTGPEPAREDDPGQPQNAYERTKAEAELAAASIARKACLSLVIARPGLVYGPGDRHLAGWFKAISRGYYRILGSGLSVLHPIYIDDLVRGLMLCASVAREKPCRTYHLVGSRPVSMVEFSEAIGIAVGRQVSRTHVPIVLAAMAGAALEALPVPRRMLPLTRSRVRFLTENRAYDNARASRELAFMPAIELQQGLHRTVAWYREQGLL